MQAVITDSMVSVPLSATIPPDAKPDVVIRPNGAAQNGGKQAAPPPDGFSARPFNELLDLCNRRRKGQRGAVYVCEGVCEGERGCEGV